jgi:selenocysteine lyase/cysteine desulfurase
LESSPYHHTFEGSGLYGQIEGVREKAAVFLGAARDEVALTANTTEGMNGVATGLGLKAGDEILTTNHEHGGGMVGWQYLAKHRGVKIVQFKIPPPAQSAEQILQLLEAHLTPRTRVCFFSHVETITGTLMPLAQIAALVHPRDILLVCDGAQAPGMLNVDVKALGVDTYASSSHKWMLAPKGSGLLYVHQEAQERVQPVLLHSGFGAYSASVGTRSWPQLIAHGLTMDFHNAIGRPQVEARCRELNTYLRQRLDPLPHLRCLTPSDPALASPGIVTYALDKGKNGEIVTRLHDEHNIWVKPAAGTYPIEGGLPREDYNALRFSTHIYNDEAQLDRAADILAGMLKAL